MAITSTTRTAQDTPLAPTLFLAFELGVGKWKLGFTTGVAQRPRERSVTAGDGPAVLGEMVRAKRRFGLSDDTPVVSCYEAGRDGFWLHRFLRAHGIENHVVDSSSIEVNRRQRRAKSDRLDVHKLLTMLLRYLAGEKKVWSVVRVPSVEAEDRRQLHRELLTAKRDRTRVTNRIQGLLAGHGVRIELQGDGPAQLREMRQWDGSPLPPALQGRLEREWQKVRFLTAQIEALEAERRELLRTSVEPVVGQVRQLNTLRGIGTNSAWLYVMEFFAWRQFRNRKQVGALAGLTPTPHQSGQSRHELGIAKAGNRHIRAMAIEMAWGWLRFQPESELARSYQARFGQGSARVRKIGIVALARKLLIALWQFLETGVLPKGALLKAEVRIR
jgi:transposase